MTVKSVVKVKPAFPFEAYSHVVSPINMADGGGFMFTMPDIPGVVADGATELEAIADGREAFNATVSAMVDMGQEIPAPAFKINGNNRLQFLIDLHQYCFNSGISHDLSCGDSGQDTATVSFS